jgi:serine/threonine protein kinase
LKPENFVINSETMEVKMIDFGTVKDYARNNGNLTSYVSTRWYRAPECVLRSHSYGPPSDIFAAGCVMAELYNNTALFPGASELDQIETIFKILGTPKLS